MTEVPAQNNLAKGLAGKIKENKSVDILLKLLKIKTKLKETVRYPHTHALV
jgi:hypothetical protein